MKKNIALLLTTILLLCSSMVQADDRGLFSPVSIRAQGNYISSADYDDSDGSSSVAGGRIRLNAGGLSFSYEGQNYSWDKVDQLKFGNGVNDPWDTLHRFTLGYAFDAPITDTWFYGLGITGTSAFEEDIEDSFGGALRGHVGYAFSKNFRAMLGVRLFINSIRYSAMPYLGIMYNDYDADGAGFFMNIGMPSNELGYAFSSKSKIRAAFAIDGKTYRLKDNSSVSDSGYVEISSMKTGLYYDWKPLKGLFVTIGPEYYFSRKTKTFDRHGDKFGGDNKQDAAFGGLLSLRYKF